MPNDLAYCRMTLHETESGCLLHFEGAEVAAVHLIGDEREKLKALLSSKVEGCVRQEAVRLPQDWQPVLDRLRDWSANAPRDDRDEPRVMPYVAAVAHAIVTYLERKGEPAPNRIVPTSDGGILMDRRDAPLLESIEITPELAVQRVRYVDGSLAGRWWWCGSKWVAK